MYPISPIFEKFVRGFQHEWDVKVDINGTEYGKDVIVDFDIENSLISANEFEIGTVIVSKLKLRLRTFDEIPPNARVVPYVALDLSNLTWRDADFAWEDADLPWEGGTTEWLPLGEFYIDSREQINDVWVFTCFDKLMFANVPYISSLTYPATMQDVWDEICGRLGFAYDSSVVINPSYTFPVAPTGYTMRQVMGYIAMANAASVYVGKEGLIKFKRFTAEYTPDFDMTTSDYVRVRQTNPVKTYTRVVILYDPEYDATYEAGEGDENHTLYLENPFATQQMADDILAAINGYSYVPIEMDSRGFPHLEPGDAIQFDQVDSLAWEDADFAWEDADIPWDGIYKYRTQILHQSLSFKGGLKMSIEAPSKSEQQSEFNVEGTLEQQVNRLTRSAVKKGRLYYGVTISDDEGLVIERSDNLAKVILNADEFSFWADGERALWFDIPSRRYMFSGTIQAGEFIGGRIDIGDGTFTVDETGHMEAMSAVIHGRFQSTDSGNVLLDVYKNENGGVMYLYDIDGQLNVTIGSEKGTADNIGGTVILYNDVPVGDDPNDFKRVELAIASAYDAGFLNLRGPNNTVRVQLNAGSNVGDFGTLVLRNASGSPIVVLSAGSPSSIFNDLTVSGDVTANSGFWVGSDEGVSETITVVTDVDFVNETVETRTIRIRGGIIVDT